MHKLEITFIGRHQRTGEDHQHDDDARHVFCPSVPVGVAACGGSTRKGEGDPERNGGKGIRKIMDGVCQEANAAAQKNNDQLKKGGYPKPDQGYFQRPDSTSAAFQSTINIGFSMTMPMQERDGPLDFFQPARDMRMIMVVVSMRMTRRRCMLVWICLRRSSSVLMMIVVLLVHLFLSVPSNLLLGMVGKSATHMFNMMICLI